MSVPCGCFLPVSLYHSLVTSHSPLAHVSSGDCCQWKSKGKCTKGAACSFHHDETKRGKSTRSFSPSPKSQTNNEGTSTSKGKSLRSVSPSGKRFQRRFKDYLNDNSTNPRVIPGIVPCVRITNFNQAASSVESARFCAQSQPNKRLKQAVGKGSEALLMHVKQLGCIFHDIEPPTGTKMLGTQALFAVCQMRVEFHDNGKKRSIAVSDSTHQSSRAQSIGMPPNFFHRPKKRH